MLQKTSKGHKIEDQWIGPYSVKELDLVKGTCKLRTKDGKLLQRKINLKDLKLYREQSTSQTSSNDALQQAPSAQQYPTPPSDTISPVPQNNQSGGRIKCVATYTIQSAEWCSSTKTCPNTNNKSARWTSYSKTSSINKSAGRSTGTTTCPYTKDKSAGWTSHSKTSSINKSAGKSTGATTCPYTNNKSARWSSH